MEASPSRCDLLHNSELTIGKLQESRSAQLRYVLRFEFDNLCRQAEPVCDIEDSTDVGFSF